MTSEDPKHPDQEAKVRDGEAQSVANDGEVRHTRPIARSSAEIETEDRWDDSEIDAVVDVLERPSQIPPSVPFRGPAKSIADDHAAIIERPSSTLSASAVEKSKRTGSDPPHSVTPNSERRGSSGPLDAEGALEGTALESSRQTPRADINLPGLPRLPATMPFAAQDVGMANRAALDRPASNPPSPANPATPRLEEEEPTAYYDRSRLLPKDVQQRGSAPAGQQREQSNVPAATASRTAVASPDASRIPAKAREATGSTTPAVRAQTDESEEATLYYHRDQLLLSAMADAPNPGERNALPPEVAARAVAAQPFRDPRATEQPAIGTATRQDEEAEEPTSFFERSDVAAASSGSESTAEPEEPTQFFERPSSSRPPEKVATDTGYAAAKAAASAAPSSGRPSSVSLGFGIALMSAETTEPPPVVEPTPSPSLAPKHAPPRPAAGRPTGGESKPPADPDFKTIPPAELPTRPVVEGFQHPSIAGPVSPRPAGSAASGDLEPMSERSNGGLGGDVEPPAQGLTGITAFSIAPRPGSAGFEDEAWLDPFAVRAGRRLVRVAVACQLAAVLVAVVDAAYARHAAANHPSWWQLTLACAGLLVPATLVLSVVVAGLSMLLHPDAAPSLRRLPHRLRPIDIRRQARLAVILAASPLAICAWIMLSARAALPLLGSTAPPPVVGMLLSAMSVGLALILAAPVLAIARYVGVRLRQNPPDPVTWGTAGLLAGLVPLLAAIVTGPTSGAGSAVAIFGVWKRPELDLRAPAMLFVIALAGYLLPARLNSLRVVWLVLVALMPLGLTARAATRGLENRSIAIAIERGAPLSRVTLAALRRATDRDHDGFSKYFGGGDCAEHDRSRNPGADDVPENGIDEDCSGSDARAVATRSLPTTPVELLRAKRTVIPSDLNLIFIIVDTMRADVLHHAKHVTPRLDVLSDQSSFVERAYSPASYTGKSVGPILIGKHSSETNRDFGHFAAFSKKDTFVQQRFQKAGIRTLSVQGYWYFFQSLYGFDRGFDVIDTAANVSAGYVEGDRSSTGEKLADRIIWQLDQAANTSGRFFLWSQFTDPHAEYVSHAGFDFGHDSLGKYHGEVAFVDHQIGRILDFVRSKPWGARTAVVVTSDHGEAFGEHGMIRHGFELWEPLVRVPLIISVPGIEPRRIQSRRSLIDLVPTFLDLMQVDMPSGTAADFVSGRSLLPELLGIDGTDTSESLLVDMANGPYTAERQAFIDGDLKLITAQGRPMGLFDLSSDPEEKKDLLDDAVVRERVVGTYRAFKKSMRVVDVRAK